MQASSAVARALASATMTPAPVIFDSELPDAQPIASPAAPQTGRGLGSVLGRVSPFLAAALAAPFRARRRSSSRRPPAAVRALLKLKPNPEARRAMLQEQEELTTSVQTAMTELHTMVQAKVEDEEAINRELRAEVQQAQVEILRLQAEMSAAEEREKAAMEPAEEAMLKQQAVQTALEQELAAAREELTRLYDKVAVLEEVNSKLATKVVAANGEHLAYEHMFSDAQEARKCKAEFEQQLAAKDKENKEALEELERKQRENRLLTQELRDMQAEMDRHLGSSSSSNGRPRPSQRMRRGQEAGA